MKNAPFIGLVCLAGCSVIFFIIMSVLVFEKTRVSRPLRTAPTQTQQQNPSSPSTTPSSTSSSQTHVPDTKTYGAASTFIDYIPSDAGAIAVRITVPTTARYSDGAPVLVYTPVFFTPEEQFEYNFNADTMGFVFLSPLYPGVTDKQSGIKSDGTFDYGGELSVKAFRDVLKFASGDLADSDGMTITQRISTPVLTDNVGIFAFSHPGIMSTNVMAYYGSELPHVHYVVNRESPTQDVMYPLELGNYNKDGSPNTNPLYVASRDYHDDGVTLDYSSVEWDSGTNTPYFDINHDGKPGTGDFIMGNQVPSMFGKQYYSQELTQALLDNGAFTTSTWPKDLATATEAKRDWPYRETVNNYAAVGKNKDLHFMLIFSSKDHVLAVNDAPQIHMAFDNLRANGIWTRLNPDTSYLTATKGSATAQYTEISANTPVGNWSNAANDGYDTNSIQSGVISLASVSEMADRVHADNWSTNLSNVLTTYTAVAPSSAGTMTRRPRAK